MEEEILTLVDANKGALEKALGIYGYLNELPEDELLSWNYSHEKIKKRAEDGCGALWNIKCY